MTSEEFKKNIIPLGNKLYGFAFRFLKDSDEAKDAIQDIYIKLWKLKDKLHEYNSIEAFAMRVTRNYCLDKIKLKKTVSLEVNPPYENQVKEKDPQQMLEINDKIKNVRKVMEQLPEQQRMIIELKDVEGYSYEEIEKVLDLNINTIRVNLSRARKRIKEALIQIENYGSQGNKAFA